MGFYVPKTGILRVWFSRASIEESDQGGRAVGLDRALDAPAAER